MAGLNWTLVTREDVIKAIELFLKENEEYPAPRSTFLVYDGKKLPAKHIRGMAYKVATGQEVTKDQYGGGMETVRFFERLGFEMFYTGKSENKSAKTTIGKGNVVPEEKPATKVAEKKTVTKILSSEPKKEEKIKIPSKGVIEQKNALQLILNRMFDGDVVCEKTYPWMKTPEKISGAYKKVYDALSSYRGDKKFAKKNVTLRCDFVVESRKLIVEYDERQHFSEARRLSLLSYPEVSLNYDRSKWIQACASIAAKDNQPVNRDETRAYYDSVRDIAAAENGYTLVRIMHGQTDFESDGAAEELKKILNLKSAENKKPGESFRVALYLQTDEVRDKVNFEKAMKQARACDADIFVFPENCYTPFAEDVFRRRDLLKPSDMEHIYGKCISLSEKISKPVVVSLCDKFGTLFSVYANADAAEDETYTKAYVKHTATNCSAFEIENYQEMVGDIFEPIILKGYKIGLTICYDCNHAVFSRIYGLQGVDIIINSTGGNVVYDKWYKYNKTRAIENQCYEFVTMGGDGKASNPHCYVYGFTPEGKEMKPECYRTQDTLQHNVPGSIYIYELSTDDGTAEDDSSLYQQEKENKNSDFDIPVGNIQALLDDAKLLTDGLYIKTVNGKNVVFVVADGENILTPEDFLPLLYYPELKDYSNRRYVLVNRWKSLDRQFYDTKLSVVLKARAMENYCAVILESDIENHCYQSGKNRTAQVVKAVDGVYGVDLERTTGAEAIWKNKVGMRASWRTNYEWLVREMKSWQV